MLPDFVPLAKNAGPAVVNINVNNGGVTGIEDVEAAGADKLVNVVTLDGRSLRVAEGR